MFLSTPVRLAIIAFTALVIAGLFDLIALGRDTTVFISFVFAIVPSTIGVVVVSGQVRKVSKKTEEVKRAVNGELDKKFAALHARLDALISLTAPTLNQRKSAHPTKAKDPQS